MACFPPFVAFFEVRTTRDTHALDLAATLIAGADLHASPPEISATMGIADPSGLRPRQKRSQPAGLHTMPSNTPTEQRPTVPNAGYYSAHEFRTAGWNDEHE
jgi:hypothetical protein